MRRSLEATDENPRSEIRDPQSQIRNPKSAIRNAAPAVTHQPGWTLIRCDDEATFRDWLKREELGSPLAGDEESALGTHVLVELYGCPHDLLDDVPTIGSAMREAADRSGATTVATSFHEFEPVGVSGAVIIQESHYTIHTWPEHEYAAVDLFFCGGTVDIRKAVEVLRRRLLPERIKFLVIRRGLEGEVDG